MLTHYKQSTILRRILRRMALRNLQDPGDYLTVLQNDAEPRTCTRTS